MIMTQISHGDNEKSLSSQPCVLKVESSRSLKETQQVLLWRRNRDNDNHSFHYLPFDSR